MKGLFAALRFLTITPVPGRYGTEENALAGSVVWFPVVGLLIGGLAAGSLYLLTPFLPPLLLAVITVLLLLVASGGLHMDGVADCADGFFSSRPRA
ncbi:MAG: adenosylcobinamide-GDP ribazoletransferase, partial [Proteobacteria bacterium]|nr:adenosylcobinamide-GDP ribazoletransferase [Pseudomonadota bacterium]MBU1715040.1 adenosylcobinamide-GDP ribazoletransferase [Pseudomonadota bacterium]